MLRGNHPATVDAKSRVKVPTAFRNLIRESYGDEFFLTSFTGENVLAYPMQEWTSMEERLRGIRPDLRFHLRRDPFCHAVQGRADQCLA